MIVNPFFVLVVFLIISSPLLVLRLLFLLVFRPTLAAYSILDFPKRNNKKCEGAVALTENNR